MKRFLWILSAPLLATGTAAAQADECSAADVVVGAPVSVPFDTNNCTDTGVAATTSLEQQCFSYSADVWVQWTATFTGNATIGTCNAANYDTEVGVWSGTNCGTLNALGCNDDAAGCAGLSSQIVVPVTMGTNYYVTVGYWTTTGITGSGTLSIDPPPVAPGNDDCAGATPLALGPNAVSTVGTTESGQTASGLPAYVDNNTADTGCQPFNANVDILFSDAFYTFSPATSGLYLLSTCNMASYDTKLATYSGACGAQTATACNDDGDGCAGFSSTLFANLTGGTSYTVQVGAFGAGQTGTATLDVSSVVDMDGDGSPSFADCDDNDATIFPGAPEVCGDGIDQDCNGSDMACPQGNDDCANAVAVTLGPNAVSTLAATAGGTLANVGTPYVDNLTPDTDCQDFGNGFNVLNDDAWYEFSPAASAVYLFSTCNMASYDTKLAAYSGTCGAPTALACNDDGTGCAGFSSELRATLAGGSSYLIQLGAFAAGQQGTATMDISIDGLPPGIGVNYCASATNGSGGMSIMGASGSASIAANNLVLEAGMMEPGQPGIFYHGQGMPMMAGGLPFGEGNRCVTGGGANVVRMAPTNADGSGLLSYALDFTGLPNQGGTLMVGSRNFQAWFRDPFCVGTTSGLAGDCNDDGIATGFNLSDGYTIVLVP